jgi:hypothetical protein
MALSSIGVHGARSVCQALQAQGRSRRTGLVRVLDPVGPLDLQEAGQEGTRRSSAGDSGRARWVARSRSAQAEIPYRRTSKTTIQAYTRPMRPYSKTARIASRRDIYDRPCVARVR